MAGWKANKKLAAINFKAKYLIPGEIFYALATSNNGYSSSYQYILIGFFKSRF